jgi:hypothetical protein
MKFHVSKFLRLFTIAALLTAVPVPLAANEEFTDEIYICGSSEDISNYILHRLATRDPGFSISVPKHLPEAMMDSRELLYLALNQDSGFIRWGFSGAKAVRDDYGPNVTFKYEISYRTTLKEDIAARKTAADIVAKWELGGLSERQKIDQLRDYISANWTYDETLENMTAYPTLTKKKGVCLGFVMASQLILDQMGILSRAVNGRMIHTETPHILLLVKIGEYWYTFDPTSVAGGKPGSPGYLDNRYGDYFEPNAMYLTESFRQMYPMSGVTAGSIYMTIMDNEIPLGQLTRFSLLYLSKKFINSINK